MANDLRIERLLVGFHSLGLLRAWPFGDPEIADRQLEEIAVLAARRGEPLPMDLLDVTDAYTDWAEIYDEPNALIDVEEVALRRMLADIPPGRALDVACGTGRVTAILAELGHEVTGVDPTPAMLERAEAKGIGATFVAGGFTDLPFADGEADLLTCCLALTHVEDLGPAIGAFSRAVKPGGVIVLSDVHPVAVLTGAHAQLKRADGTRAVTRNHVHWPSDYIASFGENGLRVERCEEPLVDEAFFQAIGNEEIRRAAQLSIHDLPFALLWKTRKG